MKILVTGANGYLGQGVVRKLLDYGHEVIATDLAIENIDERAIRIKSNLFEVEDPYAFFGQPEILLHMAWRDGFVHYSDAHIVDLPKHYSFLKTLCNTDIKTIAVMGSMHEVGFFEGCVNENTPCNPITPYGISKNALRELTLMLCNQTKKSFLWLRGFYIVGNSRHGSSVFSKITAAEEKGDDYFPFTTGKNQYDFIDYPLFCEQVAKAVTQDIISGIVNICSGRPERLSDRVERFISENNYKIRLNYGAYPDRPYDSKAIWGDESKIDKIMGMEMNTPEKR